MRRGWVRVLYEGLVILSELELAMNYVKYVECTMWCTVNGIVQSITAPERAGGLKTGGLLSIDIDI